MEIQAFFVPSKQEANTDMSLSVSKAKTFDSCKAKFKFSYIEKLPKKTWDFHIFGTFLHDTLESFHLYLMKNAKESQIKNTENKDAAQENIWADVMKKSFKESIHKHSEKLSNEQKSEAFKILQTYLNVMREQKEAGKLPEVIDVERSFYLDLNNGHILLNGFIDRIQKDHDGVLHVCDYKTTKNKKYLKDFFQLETYAYILFLSDPGLEKVRASFMCLRHDCSLIEKEYKRDDVMFVGETFVKYAKQIQEEKLWRPQPQFLCKYCDFLEHCSSGEKYLVKRGLIEETDVKQSYGMSRW